MLIIDYIILENENIDELAKFVRDKIRQGYKPQGGVCHSTDAEGMWYVQAMVKESL